MSTNTINQENITKEILFQLFNDAYLDVKKSDDGSGDYILDRYKTWFDIDKKKEFIRYSIMLRVNHDEPLLYQKINQANQKYMMCRAFYNGNSLDVDYYQWINGGVEKKNIVFTYKFFAVASAEMISYLLAEGVLQ